MLKNSACKDVTARLNVIFSKYLIQNMLSISAVVEWVNGNWFASCTWLDEMFWEEKALWAAF